MSPVSHPPTDREPLAGRDPLAERLGEAAHLIAGQTRPWPAVDGALRRDRRHRAVRRSTAAGLVAALVTAAVLPFTAVRVEPLDELAAALGLRRSSTAPEPRKLFQDVTENPDDYVHLDGAALRAPAGEPVDDAAWLDATKARAAELVDVFAAEMRYPGQVGSQRTIAWAVDDGTRTLAVVGFGGMPGTPHDPWVLLGGPSGSDSDTLALLAGDLGGYEGSPGIKADDPIGKGVVVVFGADATDPRVAGFPAVDSSGTVTTTWHPLPKVAPQLWVGLLGAEAADGWQFLGSPDTSDAYPALSGQSWAFDDAFYSDPDTRSVDALANTEPFARFAELGFAGATRSLQIGSTAVGLDADDRTTADVRIVGVRTPGGGWIVAADLRATDVPVREDGEFLEGELFYEVGERRPLSPVAAAPAPADGATPFVGFVPMREDHTSVPWVVVWAPPGVSRVRSGEVVADVADGVALLDLRTGGQRVGGGTPHQSVLIEGLDENGSVVARSRVRESYLGEVDVSEGEADPTGTLNPHDGDPQTVIAWP
jgi:hypothetical protein